MIVAQYVIQRTINKIRIRKIYVWIVIMNDGEILIKIDN